MIAIRKFKFPLSFFPRASYTSVAGAAVEKWLITPYAFVTKLPTRPPHMLLEFRGRRSGTGSCGRCRGRIVNLFITTMIGRYIFIINKYILFLFLLIINIFCFSSSHIILTPTRLEFSQMSTRQNQTHFPNPTRWISKPNHIPICIIYVSYITLCMSAGSVPLDVIECQSSIHPSPIPDSGIRSQILCRSKPMLVSHEARPPLI